MPNTEISRVQKPHAGDYPLVPGFRCVCVVVPDDVGYVQLLAGFTSLLTKAYNWQGTFDERGSRADLWSEAVAMTDFEGCTDCVQVADCIDTSDVVQSALSNWFVGAAGDTTSDVFGAIQQVYQNNVGGQPMPAGVSGKPLYDTGCVEDVVFGAVVYLIDRLDQNTIDAFEIAEELSNALERAQTLISAIPVFETLPIDEIVDYAQALWTDDLFEAYSAAVTTDYLDELKCDLFCIALDNGCTLSIDLLFHYFVTRVGADPTNDLLQLIEYLTLGVWTGTQVPDTFFALQLIAMKLGNQFFSTIGIKSIIAYMAIGAHMPDSTWVEICDVCPSAWEHVFDFTLSDGGFTSPYGSYVEGVGWVSGEIEAGLFYTALSANNATSVNANYISALYDTEGVDGDPQTDRIWTDSDIMANWRATSTNVDGTDRTLVWEGDDTDFTAIGFTAAASACVGAFCGGQVTLKSMTVRGVGTDPYL